LPQEGMFAAHFSAAQVEEQMKQIKMFDEFKDMRDHGMRSQVDGDTAIFLISMSSFELPPYRVVVFCASALGKEPDYRREAEDLGLSLAEAGMGLVYGGTSVGLMGVLADAVLANGGEAIGFLPRLLADREIAHRSLTRLEFTETMHQRKAGMLAIADAVVALPGGFGTLDELMEAVTWAQLGLHTKPCVVVNTLGYYDGLLRFLDTAVEAGFVTPANRERIQAVPSVHSVMELLKRHREQRNDRRFS
jgi:hypothetical protein